MAKTDPALAPVTGSAGVSWQCTSPAPALVFALGELKEQAGRKYVINRVAQVEQLPAGNWRWIAFVGDGSLLGFESSRDRAMKAAEDAQPNSPAQRRADDEGRSQ